MKAKKVLFLDRDGTLVVEPPSNYQLDAWQKLEFLPGVFKWLKKITEEMDYTLVMVTNQDGLGTDSFPEENFWPIQNFITRSFENEGIAFQKVHIDRSFPSENLPTRKPEIGLLTEYFHESYDLKNSIVIGDRLSDMKLAKNLGSTGIMIGSSTNETDLKEVVLKDVETWEDIYFTLRSINSRKAIVQRDTKETQIKINLNLDGTGQSKINTGLGFLDHMLDQLAKHGVLDLKIEVNGDLDIDEHHTIEDTALALGEAFHMALGNKKGIIRYGFCLPMDESISQVAIDFGGRPWLVWDAEFTREKIGDMPTEMFEHFFKSFTDTAKCNLNIKVEGKNEHHKIEAIFKGWAKAIYMAKHKDSSIINIPSTKGLLS
jgi:imidazoleglycerol-phosphate dehydratase/histidinol-phosphatase